ncbi:hypothetical protein AMATHDRAFT_198000 [Amanita thiersii Skay4041]|uniref:Uncharacterized protein n=1 Tax=Amanita thiersii Skay4041 TaxID=703135 RepID=A0A2A9NA22_9AGAR|nr:hypothetical protein AMATHDRAFT_198000 [Amanita thiersii Skay4041]
MPSSPSSTSSTPSNTAYATHPVPYKGKFTRSWPQLPDELVRHIATFYLWDLSVTSYCPQTWETREHWHHRMVYSSIRDAIHLEKNLMPVCPQWAKALESHLFWQQATALIDPLDSLAHNAFVHPPRPPSHDTSPSSAADTPSHDLPIRLTAYWHFRNILSFSCLVCRVNQPNSSVGLTTAKRIVPSPLLGSITLCRDHDRRRTAFCGICMRETPLFEALAAQTNSGVSLDTLVSCLENEDEETWPGVAATCRNCRREWLWRKVAGIPRDKEAIGGNRMVSEDWETRQCVEGFIDLAEGSITDVIGLAREKWWLRKYTRLGDMMLQALAAAKFTNATAAVAAAGRGPVRGDDGDYASELEEEEDEEEEDEEDPELMQLTEESGVRDLALGDWARCRILDGHWFSPADLWYGNVVPGKPIAVSALHPCPWARKELGLDTSDAADEHPRQETVCAEMPPSFALCEQAYIAHQRQMRVVLLPAMKNIVRRLVIECAEDAKTGGAVRGDCTWGGFADDPAIRASKMTLEEVLRILREEGGVWFDGVDWAERRMNDAQSRMRKEQGRMEGEQNTSEMPSDSPSSSTGSSSSTASDSKSGATSSATSPVLSTSTLQTTPSPPPATTSSSSTTATTVTARPITIAVSPVLDPPKLLRPIPYVPVTLSHLPQYSLEAFRAVWREACAPLYHCRCKICERAMVKANADAAASSQANGSIPVSQALESRQSASSPSLPTREHRDGLKNPHEIRLEEATEIDGDGEEEIEVELEEYAQDEEIEYEEEEEEEEEELEVSSTFGEYGERDCYSPAPFSQAPTPEVVPHGDEFLDSELPVEEYEQDRSGFGDTSEVDSTASFQQSRKRSCDELDDDVEDGALNLGGSRKEGTPPKRARKGDGVMSPALAVERINRMRKRSSEELDEEDEHGDRCAYRNRSSSERSEDGGPCCKRFKIERDDGSTEAALSVSSDSPPPTTDSTNGGGELRDALSEA